MGAHTSHIVEVEGWGCEREEEDQDSPPPPLPLFRTRTRTRTRGRGAEEELEVLEVALSSAHTCSQLPSFEIENLEWKVKVKV